MEMENFRSHTPPPIPSPATPVVNAIELTWSAAADASALTADNRKDVLRRMDNCTPWTEQKHNLYLNNLEVSFVEQLQQSKGLFAQGHDKNQRDTSTCHTSSMNVSYSSEHCSEQFTVLRNGRWQNIKYDGAEPLSRNSADSRNHLKSPWICRLRRTGMKGPSPSEDMKEFSELHEEEDTKSHGVTKSSHQIESNNPNEGCGQNFMDEGNQNSPKTEFQAKRLKTALQDSSGCDQIVPINFSSLCPPT